MNASVEIVATTGGGRQGKETQYPSFGGYIFIRKPRTSASSCASPSWVRQRSTWSATAKPGSSGSPSEIGPWSAPAKSPNLQKRPRKPASRRLLRLAIHPWPWPRPDRLPHHRTCASSRTTKKKDLIEEPDYDLQISRPARGPDRPHPPRHPHQPHRPAPLPAGHLRPRRHRRHPAFYSNYQKFGDNPSP